MENILYNDYASWIIEKSDLFEKLKSVDSILLERYQHALDVVAHLYNKKIETQTLEEEEVDILSFGFYYLFEEFEHIDLILENNYSGDVEAFNDNAQTIALFLNAIEFENEIYNSYDDEKAKPIVELEQEILSFIQRREKAPEALYEKFDEVSMRVFNELKLVFYPISEIFFDIADEMGLI